MNFLDPHTLLHAFGLAGVLFIVFAESGLLIGFVFPGDSLLFLAGVFASQGYFSIWALVIGSIIAAVVGDQVGYSIGQKIGPKIFFKHDSLFFKKRYLDDTRLFYEKYGPKTIIIARFVPIVRTFAPVLAGVGMMSRKIFTRNNIIGGMLWVLTFSLFGYFIGSSFGPTTLHLGYITGVIIFLSVAFGGLQFFVKKR